MSSKQAAVVPVERETVEVSASQPRRVYIGTDAGVYVLKTLASEATAYLKDDGSGNLTFDNDSAEDDRKPYAVSTSPYEVLI